MPSLHDDTIVAVSSPPGRSPRGLIRMSGPDTQAVLAQITDTSAVDREMQPCRLLSGRLPALLAFFAGPRSYTGQDLAELQLPGNPALLDRVVHQIMSCGARLAEPGEFTFRAYLAGKLDLTQAEGIAATIAATSDAQLHAASLLREGKLGALATALVDAVGSSLALVEAGIDFTDQDDVVPITPARLDANLAVIQAKLDDLLLHSRSWGTLEALPRVVLVGAPSAGKSTLFNALLSQERAVISEVPGTTRDLLAQPMSLRNQHGETVEVMLIDIAGLDDPRTMLDEQMQVTARNAMQSADLILLIADRDDGFVSIDALLSNIAVLRVRTKSDLLQERTRSEDAAATTAATSPASTSPASTAPATAPAPAPAPAAAVHVSAKTGRNLDTLRELITGVLGQRVVSVAGDMLALQPRHELALRSARHDLAAARSLLSNQRGSPSIQQVELIAGGMRTALDQLAALGGTLTPDDVIGRVFATFCIGK